MGFAETNSILNLFFFLFEPNLFLFLNILTIIFIQAASDNLKFKNPGPSMFISEKSFKSFLRICFIFSAIFLGLSLRLLAKTIATLQEKSKLNFSGGLSTIIESKSFSELKLIYFLFFIIFFLISVK